MNNPYQSPQPTQEPGRWTSTVLPWLCLGGTALACVVSWLCVEGSNVAGYFASDRNEPPYINFSLLRFAAWSGLFSLVPAIAYFTFARKTWLVALVLLTLLVVGMAHGLFSFWFLVVVVEK